MVGDAVSGVGDRLAGAGHDLGDRLDRAGDLVMTETRRDEAARMLRVEHLEITYRVRGQDRPVVKDVSFEVGRRESYGLVGESGSGKSTIALALTRYLAQNGRVSAGSIKINGLDPLAMSSAALRDLRARTLSMVYHE